MFPDFLRFFYPDADKIFELEKHEFLDKELEKLYPDTDGGTRRRHVDKLVKVRLRKGGEQWILIHIEVQGYADPQFGPRMFQYFYRILDRYRRPVTAIAIFTGSQKKTPESYEIEMLALAERADPRCRRGEPAVVTDKTSVVTMVCERDVAVLATETLAARAA